MEKNILYNTYVRCTVCGHFKHIRNIYLNASFKLKHLHRENDFIDSIKWEH